MTLTLENKNDNKKYLFNTTTQRERSKDFQLIITSLPTGDTDDAVINALLGVEGTINLTFEITPRTDDYTVSTGTPVSNDIDAEADWLYEEVCGGSKKEHKLTRVRNGTTKTWNHLSVSTISIPEIGDQPNKFVCRMVLKEGFQPTL